MEINAAVDQIAAAPESGDLIVGSGGLRKVRVAGRGFGKSGGYRVLTYYVSPIGVYLVGALSKGAKANFTPAQIKVLATLAKALKAAAAARGGGQDVGRHDQ